MNNFKTLRVINEADADEYVIDIDDDEEELIAKAGKEAEFVDLHTAVSIAHPVAGDNQFKSDKDQAVTQNAESDNAEGEDKPVKQGTTGDTKFAQFRDKIGKTPARKGDKSQGDMKAETVKEEVELDEDASNFKSAVARIKKANSVKDLEKLEKSLERVYKQTNALTAKEFGQLDSMIVDKKVKLKEEVELDEAQKLFMFKTKPEADKKAKEIKGKVISLGPKNFAVVTMDLTVVREEIEEGILELEDGKFVYVSDDDAEVFNTILEELEPENRELMIIRMNENEDSYEEMLEFAKGMV